MTETLLKIEHLVKKFDDNLIMADINLEVKKGEVIVVIGPSGCGKSTLLRCINALEPIQGGTISLDGEPIDDKSRSLSALREKIGTIFHSYELFPNLSVTTIVTLVTFTL